MKKRIVVIFTSIVLLLASTLVFGCNKKCKKEENNPTEVVLKFVSDGVTISEKKVAKGYLLVESDFPTNIEKEGYDFSGWYMGELRISVGFVINEDTTIVSKFTEKSSGETKQDGSKEYPYILSTPEDVVNFSDRMNHLDEEVEDKNYHKAYFVLANDIDMDGVKYTPAGKEIVIETENGEQTIYGFMGKFDGKGHTISNLTISLNMKTNRNYLGGLFGLTHEAYIHDLKLENINYTVESGSDDANRSVLFGGVVGLAELTVFENIDVTGTMTTYIFENNGAKLGGLAGAWDVSDGAGSYYAYARNCHTNIETKIGELDGEVCSLESGFNGGLFGYVYNYNSAVSIYNCITEGYIRGGKYVGGLVGAFASENVSVLDSGSYATVYATATEVSYAGGLVGMSQADIIIKDCFFNGPVVKGNRASSSTYQSYAGGIIGYAVEDDYEVYYTGGLACVNAYYKTIVRGANKTSTFGTSTDQTIDATFVKETLKWNEEAYQDVNGILLPNPINIDEKNYQVKFIVDGKVVDTIEKEGNTILGILPDGKNEGSNIFFSWSIQEGSKYRSYMPVTKDIEIYGTYYDVSEIAGIYSGTATLYETTDAGLFILFDDGTLQWINSSTVNGKYCYDGEHIMFEVYNNIADVSGTLIDGELKFLVDAGMSGQVSYVLNKTELSLFGEYFSESGDIITFGSEGNLSFQSSAFRQGDYVNGTYTQEGNTLVVSGTYLVSTYSSMTIVDNGDLTLTVNFISKDPAVPSLENVVFKKILSKDYANYPFIGSYDFVYVSSSRPILQTQYTLQFNANGTANYISAYSNIECQYYVFNEGKTIKVILEGYASEFTYDEENNFFHGVLNRGISSTRRGIALIPSNEGQIYGLVINGVDNVLFATTGHSFLFKNGDYQKDAMIDIPSFENKSRIMVNNEAYIILYDSSEYTDNIGYYLEKVGVEEGNYTYNNQAFALDGIGNVTGEITGTYQVYENNLVVILTDNDQFIGFDYQGARENNGVIAPIEPDKHQGIWFGDYATSEGIEKKHYKLLIDGYGHSTFMYLKYYASTDEYKYTYNWGDFAWVEIFETATGLTCDFNPYQHCEMRFYYDNNLMYSTNFGYIQEIAMYKDGYTGSMVPPSLPVSAVGRYVGEDSHGTPVVLNLRLDLNGSYAGNPFVATYDGESTVSFKIQNVLYRFNIQTLVLSYNDVNITLSTDGEIEEVIPEALCGVWSGTWEGIGSDKTTTLKIEKDGTITYVSQTFANVTFDYETMTINASGFNDNQDEISIVIVYNADANTINVVYTRMVNSTCCTDRMKRFFLALRWVERKEVSVVPQTITEKN